MEKRIGLIGVGLVGSALAENLVAAGYDLAAHDVVPDKCRAVEAIGAVAAASCRAAAAGRPIVILSLMNSDIVHEVLHGPAGVLSAGQPPAFIIDTTTGDPEQTVRQAADLAERGIEYLDATLSGSSEQIRRRRGLFMVGGRAQAFQACRGVFDALAEKTFHVGPPGSGAKTKLAVNLALGLNRLALAEALVFAEALGLEAEAFFGVLTESAAYSRIMDTKGPKMLTGDFTAQARLAQHRKDVGIILAYAAKLGLKLPLSATHAEVLDRAVAAGDGDLDNSAVIRQVRREGGTHSHG